MGQHFVDVIKKQDMKKGGRSTGWQKNAECHGR